MRRINILPIIFSLLLLIQGCEKIGSDDSPPITVDPTNGTGGTQKVFYTFQNNNAAIDPKQLVSSFDIKSLKIKDLPIYGKAEFLPEGILNYTPDENIIEADDQFTLSLEKKDGSIIEDKIVIKIVPEEFDLPCISNAMPDRAKTEINKPILIDVLKNDLVCDGTLKGIEKIVTQPTNGLATIENNTINYSPKKDFKGEDILLYSIIFTNNKGVEERRFAYVKITIVPSNLCVTKLNNDIINFKPKGFKDTVLLINVFNNDIRCPNDIQAGATAKFEIFKKPNFGKADILNNNGLIAYRFGGAFPNPSTIPFLDSIVYKWTTSVGSNKATVYIKEEKPVNNCKPIAAHDEFIFSLKNLAGKAYVDVNVLKNDYFCPNSTISPIFITNIAPKNSNIVKINETTIRYTPFNAQFKKEEIVFSYEFMDNYGIKTIGISKIKFVD